MGEKKTGQNRFELKKSEHIPVYCRSRSEDSSRPPVEFYLDFLYVKKSINHSIRKEFSLYFYFPLKNHCFLV